MWRLQAVRVHAVFLALWLALAQEGITQSATTASEKAAFQAEVNELKKSTPAEFENMKRMFTFATESLLARLGYGVGPFDGLLDEKTAAALRTYQKSRGIPVTGDALSFETVEAVRKDGATLDQTPTSLPRRLVFTDLWDTGYVSATGTWTIAGEDQAWPQQASKIKCHRDSGVCTEATAVLNNNDGQASLFVDVDTYEIERWDQYEVVTKPLQLGCTRYVKRIARLQKAASGIRSTTSSDAFCKDVDQSEKYLTLVDGFDLYWKLKQGYRAKLRELMLIAPALLKEQEEAKPGKK
jgi:hypothetical protein